MKSTIILVIFMLFTIGLLWITRKEYKEGDASRTWKLFGGRAYYWQWIILFSGFFTLGVVGLLAWTGIF